MAQQQSQNSNNLNAFSVMNTWMHADPVEGSQKRPSLRFGVFGNQPRITVRTNLQGDMNNGKIEFKTDLPTFAAAIKFARDLVEGKTEEQARVFVYRDDYIAGKKLDKFIDVTKLQIGRDGDGRVYIAVLSTQQSRPRIKFYFGPSKYHNITKPDGSPISPKEMSEAYAFGFLEPAYALVLQLLVHDFDPNARGVSNPAAYQNGGGNGGGQRSGGGNGHRGGGRPSYTPDNSFDDELPEF